MLTAKDITKYDIFTIPPAANLNANTEPITGININPMLLIEPNFANIKIIEVMVGKNCKMALIAKACLLFLE